MKWWKKIERILRVRSKEASIFENEFPFISLSSLYVLRHFSQIQLIVKYFFFCVRISYTLKYTTDRGFRIIGSNNN